MYRFLNIFKPIHVLDSTASITHSALRSTPYDNLWHQEAVVSLSVDFLDFNDKQNYQISKIHKRANTHFHTLTSVS